MIPGERFELTQLIPHRPPMRLLAQVIALGPDAAEARAEVRADDLFVLPGLGLPTWVGLELIGQTAALIGGYQELLGTVAPHTGFLLGVRGYRVTQAYFPVGGELHIRARQAAGVGQQLAAFDGEILLAGRTLARGQLSVFRRPKNDG